MRLTGVGEQGVCVRLMLSQFSPGSPSFQSRSNALPSDLSLLLLLSLLLEGEGGCVRRRVAAARSGEREEGLYYYTVLRRGKSEEGKEAM